MLLEFKLKPLSTLAWPKKKLPRLSVSRPRGFKRFYAKNFEINKIQNISLLIIVLGQYVLVL